MGIVFGHRLDLVAPYCTSSDHVYHVNFSLTQEILLSFHYNSPHHCCREQHTCFLLAVILLEAMTYIYSLNYQYFCQHLHFISHTNCGDLMHCISHLYLLRRTSLFPSGASAGPNHWGEPMASAREQAKTFTYQ